VLAERNYTLANRKKLADGAATLSLVATYAISIVLVLSHKSGTTVLAAAALTATSGNLLSNAIRYVGQPHTRPPVKLPEIAYVVVVLLVIYLGSKLNTPIPRTFDFGVQPALLNMALYVISSWPFRIGRN
jgi:hypothetical protein